MPVTRSQLRFTDCTHPLTEAYRKAPERVGYTGGTSVFDGLDTLVLLTKLKITT